ncbi:MAG: exopolysaccharide biosynthesis polyprenyl glycosylphosphotransferase [Clostridia bacterium]|nr:exopolysaccharide biosynthesis polyprenyl glycosylphosphotransferase [Clostridia bacterium]
MRILIKMRKTIMLIVKCLIVLALTTSFVATWNENYVTSLFSNKGNYLVVFSIVFVFSVFSSLYGAFRIGIYRIHEIIYSFSLAAIITDIIMYFELSLIARELAAVKPMMVYVIFQVIIIVICSFAANTIYFRLHPARRIIAVFNDDAKGFDFIKKMAVFADRFKIESGLNVEHTDMDVIKRKIDKYDAVAICDIDKQKQKEIMTYCYTNQKRTYLLPDITDIVLNNGYEIQIGDTPVIMSRNQGLTLEQAFIKRLGDLLLSIVGILITSPIMLICAIAIKLDDGGPIFFKQNRITRNGKIFNIIKFRSMVTDADKDGAKKAENDDLRITRVGKVIRSCRVDELPQLFNVLKGEMSIVGPRPERIENVYEYTNAYPEFDLRHRVKAGLTGFAQLYGKYNTSPEDKLNMDLTYIETYSLLKDLKLIILTFKVLFMKESTEGFDKSANETVEKPDIKRNTEDDENAI